MIRTHTVSAGGEIFAPFAAYLIALCQCRQRIRYRHFSRLVALESHALEDFAAGETIALADQVQQFLASAAAAYALLAASARSSAAASRRLAGLRGFVCFDRGELAIDLVELALQLFLLIEDVLALGSKPLALSRHEA